MHKPVGCLKMKLLCCGKLLQQCKWVLGYSAAPGAMLLCVVVFLIKNLLQNNGGLLDQHTWEGWQATEIWLLITSLQCWSMILFDYKTDVMVNQGELKCLGGPSGELVLSIALIHGCPWGLASHPRSWLWGEGEPGDTTSAGWPWVPSAPSPLPAVRHWDPTSSWNWLQEWISAVVNTAAGLPQSNRVNLLLLVENWFYRLLKAFINGRHYGALNLYSGYNTSEWNTDWGLRGCMASICFQNILPFACWKGFSVSPSESISCFYISNSCVLGEQCKPAPHHLFNLTVSWEKHYFDTWASREY